MAQTAKSCSQYSHKQQIITQIRTKYTAALAHETNSTSTTKDSPLIVRIPNWIAPSERRRTNGTNQRATNRCVTNHNQRLIESNRGGRTGSARYLLAALDVLDGDELTSPAVAHEAGAAMSRTSSYRSLSCMIGMSMPGPTVSAARSGAGAAMA